MSLGDLTEEEVEGIRSGRIEDPSVSQVAALAEVFGVRALWFMESQEEPLILDEEAVRALRDETAAAVLREVMRLPERERRIVLGIARQFEEAGERSTCEHPLPEALKRFRTAVRCQLVDLGLRDGRASGEEVEVAAFVGLGRVPDEDRPVPAPVIRSRRLPRGAAVFEIGFIDQQREAPVRDVELDEVACFDKRQWSASV